MNWLRIALLNLTLVWKDRMGFVFMIGMPVAFTYFFGLAFGPAEHHEESIHVADYDGGRMAQLFVEQLKAPGFKINVLDADRRDGFEGRSRTLVIPKGFTDQVLARHKSKVYLVFQEKGIGSPNDLSVKVHLIETLGKLLPGMVKVQLLDKLAHGLDAWEDLDEELGRDMPVTVEVRSASNVPVPPSGFSQSSVGILVLFVLINTVVFGGNRLALERQGGHLRRVATSPVSRAEILLGMVVGRWVLAMAQILLLIVATSLLFHVNWGENPPALGLVVGAFAFACASLGLLSGSWVSSPDQAVLLGVVGGNVMGALGGCWWPLEIMPESWRTVAYLFPTGWTTHGLHEVVSWGRGTGAILPETFALLLFGLAFLVLAARILKYE